MKIQDLLTWLKYEINFIFVLSIKIKKIVISGYLDKLVILCTCEFWILWSPIILACYDHRNFYRWGFSSICHFANSYPSTLLLNLYDKWYTKTVFPLLTKLNKSQTESSTWNIYLKTFNCLLFLKYYWISKTRIHFILCTANKYRMNLSIINNNKNGKTIYEIM